MRDIHIHTYTYTYIHIHTYTHASIDIYHNIYNKKKKDESASPQRMSAQIFLTEKKHL